jgi:hypothetical protein
MSTAPANPNKALWENGDFTRIADSMRGSGAALVQRIGVTAGLRVLGLRRAGYLHLRFQRRPVGVRVYIPDVLRADDERV